MFKAVALAAVALTPNREDGKPSQETVPSSGALKVQLQSELWIARPARIMPRTGAIVLETSFPNDPGEEAPAPGFAKLGCGRR